MKKERISKRKLQSIETRNRIFEAARQLISEHGFENVSVDSIVETAAVSKGAFYVHFESKDALAFELVNYYTNLADIDYKSFLATLSDQQSVFDVLVLLAEKIAFFLTESIGYENMKVLYKSHLSKTFDTMPAMSYSRELYKIFAEVLEKGVQRGEIREDVSVDSLAKHLILAIRGIAFEWCMRYPDFDLKEQILDHFKILLYGLKK
ncbi:MAG TPA: TetR/AcrR family transcriptional regulator [Clostridiaceae bacterium]|nr:TetR/AcrR family transcriptional regulator [Clostridiaceae bacterium]